MNTDKLNDSFGNGIKEGDFDGDDKTPSEDKSDQNNMFNRVNLRPFELHSNTTSANVSRRGSFLMGKSNDDNVSNNKLSIMNGDNGLQAVVSGIDHLSIGNISANISRSGSIYG